VVDDPSWTPQPNGCSVPWHINCIFHICATDKNNPAGCENTSFLDSCNEHDECYQTCDIDNKDTCDGEFYSNLAGVCLDVPAGECHDDCIDWASWYVWAVEEHGDDAWQDDQVAACACCDCN